MKRLIRAIICAGVMCAVACMPVQVKAVTHDQLVTQQMLMQSAPFGEAFNYVLQKMNQVEKLKKKGASLEAIMAAQAEVDKACAIYNQMTNEAFCPLTYYGVYPMGAPKYDQNAYTNMHDYKLEVLHETNLIRKNDLNVRTTQGVATNTLWLLNQCKAELDAMEIKVQENPTLLPQLDELRRMYNAYLAEYQKEQMAANGAKQDFNNAVDTFPSAVERNGSNPYSYMAP